ncbi:hypothetical protein M0P65_05325 [Candidatus Gracilibacteria bacterium]|nr:hypothetical protein [Candidatus Gracilibacteria bacterium]
MIKSIVEKVGRNGLLYFLWRCFFQDHAVQLKQKSSLNINANNFYVLKNTIPEYIEEKDGKFYFLNIEISVTIVRDDLISINNEGNILLITTTSNIYKSSFLEISESEKIKFNSFLKKQVLKNIFDSFEKEKQHPTISDFLSKLNEGNKLIKNILNSYGFSLPVVFENFIKEKSSLLNKLKDIGVNNIDKFIDFSSKIKLSDLNYDNIVLEFNRMFESNVEPENIWEWNIIGDRISEKVLFYASNKIKGFIINAKIYEMTVPRDPYILKAEFAIGNEVSDVAYFKEVRSFEEGIDWIEKTSKEKANEIK